MGSAYWSSSTQEAERPDLIGHLPSGEGWPEIFFQDAIAKQFMPPGRRTVHLNVVVLDDGDRVIADGWGVPIVWDGDAGHLPPGLILDHDTVVDVRTGQVVDDGSLCG